MNWYDHIMSQKRKITFRSGAKNRTKTGWEVTRQLFLRWDQTLALLRSHRLSYAPYPTETWVRGYLKLLQDIRLEIWGQLFFFLFFCNTSFLWWFEMSPNNYLIDNHDTYVYIPICIFLLNIVGYCNFMQVRRICKESSGKTSKTVVEDSKSFYI